MKNKVGSKSFKAMQIAGLDISDPTIQLNAI
jgi:hypothetical protein